MRAGGGQEDTIAPGAGLAGRGLDDTASARAQGTLELADAPPGPRQGPARCGLVLAPLPPARLAPEPGSTPSDQTGFARVAIGSRVKVYATRYP